MTPRNNTMALTGAISAGVGWVVGGLGTCVLMFIPYLNILSLCTLILFPVANLVAVITGYMGRNQIRQSGGAEAGEGLAMTGLALGGIGLVLSILLLCVLPIFGTAILALLGPAIGNVFSNIIETI